MREALKKIAVILTAGMAGAALLIGLFRISPVWASWDCYAPGTIVTHKRTGMDAEVLSLPWYRRVTVRLENGKFAEVLPEELE